MTGGGARCTAKPFEEHRPHLRAVAYRMLGSLTEADDAVQEAWLRMDRTDVGDVRNLRGWLTTVVARICLDMLRARSARRESRSTRHRARRRARCRRPRSRKRCLPTPSAWRCSSSSDPVRRPSGSRSCCTTCSTCRTPRSRRSWAAPRTPPRNSPAARAVAACAVKLPDPATDLVRQRRLVDAFLAAARDGDFDALLAVLDGDVVLHVDATAAGTPTTIRGAQAVAANARAFSANARFAEPALVDGAVGIVVAPREAGAGAALQRRRRQDHRDRHRRRPAAAEQLQFGRADCD